MNTSTIIMVIAIIVFLILPTLKPRKINIKRLVILPALFIYFLYNSLTENFHIVPLDYFVIVLGIMMGIFAGIFSRKSMAIHVDKKEQMISMPGTYLNLITFLLIFTAHYIVGYLNAVESGFFKQDSFSLQALIFLLTFASTINAGGNLVLFYRYVTAKEITC